MAANALAAAPYVGMTSVSLFIFVTGVLEVLNLLCAG
jgi:hypothetical protein